MQQALKPGGHLNLFPVVKKIGDNYIMEPLQTPSKSHDELVGLSHSPIVNNFLALKDTLLRVNPRYRMDGLVEENKSSWFFHNLGHLGGSPYKPYPDYTQVMEENGVYPLQTKNDTGEISIALLSDWASDTPESQYIAELAGVQDYSIHMGDTYYVGSVSEIADNFDDEKGAPWKYGKIGSFAMLGNHEMYSGGKGYFTQLLPFMGLYYNNIHKPVVTQKASFFCLQNAYWKIVCLDTGYDSLTGFLKTSTNANLQLGDQQTAWLKNIAFANPADKQGIIFLSHHQPFSAFEAEFTRPADTLAPLIGTNKTILWFCGHEHRMAVYGANALKWNSQCFMRCIGHGGMPVEFKPVKSSDPSHPENRNLVLYDRRVKQTVRAMFKNVDVGHNGFVILRLNNEKLVADYYDDSKDPNPVQPDSSVTAKKLLTEEWSIDIQSGLLSGVAITDMTETEPEANRFTRTPFTLETAIGK
jgi:Calcineurin-like phosphoesterase